MNQGKSTLRATYKPRDISEGLGYLPPQAVEFEETVLGAILTDSRGYDHIKDILTPDHFYIDTHKEVFAAITALKSDSAPVDMRTVVNQLRKTGKLELVGGMHYVAELSSKASSTDNIEYHARVIIEMSLKRSLIQTTSNFQSNAYKDTSDAFELLDALIDQVAAIRSTNVSEPKEAKIKAAWKEILLEEEPPAETPILFIDGVPVGTPGNHSLIIGKKKSRKTLFLVWLITEYLKLPGTSADDVAFFDTEQGKSHVYKIRQKVEKITGKKIPVFYLRGRSPEERKEVIESTLLYWKSKIKLLFIDGIRDCVSNINDIDECTDLIVWLEKQTLLHNVHICNVIHMNKGDDNARGHIGTELANKAQTMIALELDKSGVTMVKCEASRDKPFEPFAFTHGVDELPEIVGIPTEKGEVLNEEDEHNRIRFVFEERHLSYKEMIEAIKNHFECGDTKAKQRAARWQRNKWVIKSGKDRSRDTKYSLITETFATLPPLEEVHPPQQQSMFVNEPTTDELPF